MTQMTAKAGVKKHGKAAVTALFEEFFQLDDKTVFKGVDQATLSRKQKRMALRAINLIKEKRCGKLKGRTVADGSVQRNMCTKEETASSTVSNDALMLTMLVDAWERRDVGSADVNGAYLHADMDDYTLLKLEGGDVDIMCRVNQDYEKFVCYENGKKVLYLQLLKALYGCVKSALLWYDLFSTTLKDLGFVLNPYDECVANKMINGAQCTIAWHVDDNKISHVDSEVVSDVIKSIEDKFGKMTVTRGKSHVFLGMKINFTGDGRFSILMDDHLQEAIDEFGEELVATTTTPAKKDLFAVNPDSKPLGEARAKTFHSVSAKLLYICTRARLDVKLGADFCVRGYQKAQNKIGQS